MHLCGRTSEYQFSMVASRRSICNEDALVAVEYIYWDPIRPRAVLRCQEDPNSAVDRLRGSVRSLRFLMEFVFYDLGLLVGDKYDLIFI